MSKIYSREPVEIVDGVPIFTQRLGDAYTQNYDEIASDHLKSLDRGFGNPFIGEFVWKDIELNAINLISSYVSSGSRILDVGVGTGRLLANFPQLDRFGIDVSLGYLRRLKGSNIEVCVGNVEDLPYEAGTFDAIVCTDVLEHVLDLYVAVKELRRLLKSGGLLIVRVPYRENLALYLRKDYPYKLAHVRNFDEFALEILFTRVLDLDLLETRFDVAMVPATLKVRVKRGRTFLTKILMWVVKRLPRLKKPILLLFAPVEITTIYRAP
jgi:SAM-dependent methyltransferase